VDHSRDAAYSFKLAGNELERIISENGRNSEVFSVLVFKAM
jgi:hypothetical protein